MSVMKNNLLLNTILERTKASSDLVTARLISSEWKQLATEVLKERYWTTRRFQIFENNVQIQNYLDTFTHVQQSVMFTCFKMVSSDNLEDNLDGYWMDKFFQTFPHSIKSLELELRFDSPMQFHSILRTQAKSLEELTIFPTGLSVFEFSIKDFPVDFYLSSLKYFCVRSEFDMVRASATHMINFLEIIFSRIPAGNKNTIQICIDDYEQIMGKATLVELLKKFKLVKSLKFLQISHDKNAEFKILITEGVQPDCLIINFEYTEEDNLELTQRAYEYLCYQTETLKMLSWRNSDFKFPLGEMPALTKLRLEYTNLTDMDYYVADDDGDEEESEDENEDGNPPIQNPIFYSEMFPNLKMLQLSSCYKDQKQPQQHFQSMFLIPELPCLTLEKLEIAYDGINGQLVTKISTIFPRIKSLIIYHFGTMSDEEEQWDFYFALWNAEFKTTIEELIIQFDGLLSCQIDIYSLFIGRKKGEIGQEQCFMNNDPSKPSIYNYTNLKRLELHTTSAGYVEEVAALSMFAKIENLKYLHVDKETCEFSSTIVEELKNFFCINLTISSLPPSVENPIEKICGSYFNFYPKSTNILD